VEQAGGLAGFALGSKAALLPLSKVLDAVGTDAQFDHVQSHQQLIVSCTWSTDRPHLAVYTPRPAKASHPTK
jgi:hypothetical protein